MRVRGHPVSQGSMIAVYNRTTERASVRHSQPVALIRWRQAVGNAFRATGQECIEHGPVVLEVSLAYERPASHRGSTGGILPRYENAYPTGDVDKGLRAIMDALTGIAYHDDSQVVDAHVTKVWGTYTHITVKRPGLWDE